MVTVGELIELLSTIDESKKVFISSEGGCVVDDNIIIREQDSEVFLEI